MLTVGDKLPSLIVPVQQGTSALPAGETLDLGQTNGKWKVLFYWPKDFTFVCPTEIVGYGDLASDFADRDAELIGASTDTSHVHFAWRKSDEQLANADFPWIADNSKALAEALGIVHPQTSAATRPRRCACSTRCRPTSCARATGPRASRC
jgi:lipoyl-dependent peroxiredoxin subunit C